MKDCDGRTGIASCERVEPYTRTVQDFNNVCMTPGDRARAMVGAANAALGAAGVPATQVQMTAGTGAAGAFGFKSWQMKVDPTQFDDVNVVDPGLAADAANTVYHESRHTEQWFRMAQRRAGLGESAALIAKTMGIPADIAARAAANPILQCDLAEHEAAQFDTSIYGAGAAHRDHVLGGPHWNQAAYCALPEEADAWKTGAEVTHAYPDGADDRHLELCR